MLNVNFQKEYIYLSNLRIFYANLSTLRNYHVTVFYRHLSFDCTDNSCIMLYKVHLYL